MKWIKNPHPIWGEGGTEEDVHKILKRKDVFPTFQYVSLGLKKQPLSIIPPCEITLGKWELYDGEDVYRFDTLQNAKRYAKLK